MRGVILVGTPNQGSEWARLRLWLELHDQLLDARDRRYSLFAALRDGTDEAKIDLRPGSDFLKALNARAWPESVPIRLIGGVMLEPSPTIADGVAAITKELPFAELESMLASWWSEIGEGLGDGVVSLNSLGLPEAPPPILVQASHRGMLMRFLPNDREPPAIAPILGILNEWSDPNERSDPRKTFEQPGRSLPEGTVD